MATLTINGGFRETVKMAASTILATLAVLAFLNTCQSTAVNASKEIQALQSQVAALEAESERRRPLAERFLGYEALLPRLQEDIRELRASIDRLNERLSALGGGASGGGRATSHP